MDKIQKLFEGIDAKVLTEEVKTAIIEEFNKAVDTKAETKATELFKSKEDEYSKALDEMFETATKTIQADNEEKFAEAVKVESDKICEAYAESVKADAEAKLNEEVVKLTEQFNKYITYAAQQFIDENEAKWLQEADVRKSNKIQEAFVKLATSFGVDMLAITEEKTNESAELEKAVEANLKLQEEVKRLNKEIMLDESIQGLTAPQADKLKKLMEEVSFDSIEQFGKKLELYKSAVTASVVGEEKKEAVNESVLPSWKRTAPKK